MFPLGPLNLLYRRAVFPLLGLTGAEEAHTLALNLLATAGRFPAIAKSARLLDRDAAGRLAVQTLGLDFPNPIGLAAGFDKNGIAIGPLLDLGFGFVEAGTVTPHAQPGNRKPRMHRLERHSALINSLGFPNEGVTVVADRLRSLGRRAVIGVNLGKGKDTPLESAADDYLAGLDALYALASYVVINVSSPNTQGLRQLQARTQVSQLARAVTDRAGKLATQFGIAPRPILLKIGPDLTWPEVDDVLVAVQDTGLGGIIATNTTTGRQGLSPREAALPGGLSGRPLRWRSTEVIRYIARQTGGRLPIIGAGGVFDAGDVWEKLEAGAGLVQAYTGFVYGGPTFALDIQQGLLDLLDLHDCRSLADAFPHLR